jgi:hypothetical protein
LDLSHFGDGRVIDLLDERESETMDGNHLRVKLEEYGYHWFRVGCEQG